MKIIRNNIIPFGGYKLINICGIIFAKKNAEISEIDLNHEKIHSCQIFEMLIIFFYLWYGIEWFIRFFFSKDRFTKYAYKNMTFEREAYINQENMNYISKRKHYNWIKLLHK